MSKQQITSPWETEFTIDFDYDNVDPETLKEWEAEIRQKNWRDMRSYLKQFPDATQEEKKALRSWVRSGHSPYENGDYIATESGGPMDFINALRFLEDEYQAYLKDPDGYLGRLDSDMVTTSGPSYDLDTGEELPF